MGKHREAIRTKKSEIVKYWYEKQQREVGDNRKIYITDIGEPTCMACDKRWGTKYDNQDENATNEECYKLWDKVGRLQRCHIIPMALGGNDEPENYWLMCKQCHVLAPDTVSKKVFFLWADQQNHREAFMAAELAMQCDFKEKDIDNIGHIMLSKDFIKFSSENSVHHFDRDMGAVISPANVVAMLDLYLNKKDIVVQRFNAGKKRKKEAGGFTGGPTPYGMKSDGQGGLTEDPAEQEVIRLVRGHKRKEVN